MAIDQTMLAADFAVITGDLPVLFTWTKVSTGTTSAAITGTIGDIAATDRTFDAGFLAEFDLELSVKKSLFGATFPIKGDHITANSVTYQIEKITQDPNDPIIRYGLMTKNK